jgi:hypothetical protein
VCIKRTNKTYGGGGRVARFGWLACNISVVADEVIVDTFFMPAQAGIHLSIFTSLRPSLR